MRDGLLKLLQELKPVILLVGALLLSKYLGITIPPTIIQPPDTAAPIINIHPPTAPPQDTQPPKTPKPVSDPVPAISHFIVAGERCTCTVVGPQIVTGRWDVLCAAHCVKRVGQIATVCVPNVGCYQARVESIDRKADVAWLTFRSGASLPYATLADALPDAGTAIWQQGFGVDQPGVRKPGTVVSTTSVAPQIEMKLHVSPGDSGGGIFRQDTGELVAVVSSYGSGSTFGGSSVAALRSRPPAAITHLFVPPVLTP